MSENLRQLQALVEELNKRRTVYTEEAVPAIKELYKARERKGREPEPFKESSFLYIRTHAGDIGNRPLPSMNFWNTPDISFSPITTTIPLTTNELRAGETYRVACKVHNRGDVTVPFPKVEFFLTDPSLGFDTRFATYIGVTQMNGLLLSNGVGEAYFSYTVPPQEAGHKCFFARTYSFSPLDKPNDVYALNPVTDRHIAQKNLHIVQQANAYNLQWIHLPNALGTLRFLPLSTKDLVALGDPAIGQLDFREQRSAAVFMRQEVKVLDSDSRVIVKRGRMGFALTSAGDGPGEGEQAEIAKAYLHALEQIRDGKAKRSSFKDLFTAKRKMDSFRMQTKLQIAIPSLNLAPGQAVGINLVNTNSITGEVNGGITLVVTG